ncbi:MAG: hypothetical protein AB1391_00315 [Candidatus Micrarchaeota archaeon]
MDIEDINLLKDTEAYINSLKNKKAELIKKIMRLNNRLKYKQYEQKALEPFLEQTKHIRIDLLRKKHRQLEFTISTQAYTPKIERDLVREVKKIENELAKVSDVERARQKKHLVDEDITYLQREIVVVDSELKKIRDELNEYYEELRASKKEGTAMKTKSNNHMMALADIAVFEKED